MQEVQRYKNMHIEFLLEERSAEVTLKLILPKILPDDVSYNFHVFNGKPDLLKKLSARLKGYSKWMPDDWRIVVLIDEDRKNCQELKTQLENAAHQSGLVTKSRTLPNGDFQVVNRLAIEELEAWFFGDIEALHEAYPSVSKNLQYQKKYRDPDAITGGTYEALERLLIKTRDYVEKIPKIEVAQNIAHHMKPSRNRSNSFQVFVEGLRACVGIE